MVGQQRQLELENIFQYELYAVPSSLIDEYGCLRKGSKSALSRCLCVLQPGAPSPDIIIVDAQQLLYHITWPHGGHVTVLVDNMESYLSKYPTHWEKILVFD